jgi:DNA primase
MFGTQEEQEQAASLFNTRLKGLQDAREREKALKDIVISIRKAAAERDRRQIEEGMQEPSAEILTRILTTRKELQALQKISFKLGDAEDPQ